jgi:hypothetical protein
VIVGIPSYSVTRRVLLTLLGITATLHLLLCAFGPHAHGGLTSDHRHGVAIDTDAPPAHGPDGDQHGASCAQPAVQPAPAALPSGGARVTVTELQNSADASVPRLPGDSPRAEDSLLTVVCVARV